MQQPGRAPRLQVRVERGGQLEGGPRPPDERQRGLLLARPVQGELDVADRAVAQLLAEVAEGEIGQIEGPLAGQREIGGQRRVGRQIIQNVPVRCQCVDGSLGIVQRLGVAIGGQPLAQGAIVVRGQRGGVDERAGAVAAASAMAATRPVPRPQVPETATPVRSSD